jgi:hypothetical protein
MIDTSMVSGRTVKVQQAVFLNVQVGHLEPLSLQLAHGIEHGLVLRFHRDEVLAAGSVEMGRALDRQVVALSGPGSPHDLPGVSVDQGGHILP